MPSNEGRGYVLRRIMRRAIRHGYKLGLNGAFFYKLVAPLAEIMGGAYPELNDKRKLIEKTIHAEERSEEHTSELQSLMRISYAVFCLKKKKPQKHTNINLTAVYSPHTTY